MREMVKGKGQVQAYTTFENKHVVCILYISLKSGITSLLHVAVAYRNNLCERIQTL